jgi:hypothetical protein
VRFFYFVRLERKRNEVPVTPASSKTLFADLTLGRTDLSPEARATIEAVRETWRADEEVVTGRPGVCKRLGCKPTHGRDLERQSKIVSFLEGGNRRIILVSSIYEHLIRQILASFPLNQPPLKAPGGVHIRALTTAPASKARPPRVRERIAAAPLPAAKRGRGRPRKQLPELTVTLAE